MIIVKLDGGMGNQLFQYAMGRYLSIKLKTNLKLDRDLYLANSQRHYSLHHFDVEESFCTPNERKALKRKDFLRRKLNNIGFAVTPYWYTEEFPGYHNYTRQARGDAYFEGFWQSEKYFKPAESIIRNELVVKTMPSDINKRLLDEIGSVNAVSVHVRRGDYVSDSVTNAVHGICDINYYKQALNLITTEIADPSFFVFSDDMSWTRSNIMINGYPVTYVDHNAEADYEDFRLMYSCRHHIIANSSFSWWGAWLNSYPGKKVIAPKNWFRSQLINNDIIPQEWQVI